MSDMSIGGGLGFAQDFSAPEPAFSPSFDLGRGVDFEPQFEPEFGFEPSGIADGLDVGGLTLDDIGNWGEVEIDGQPGFVSTPSIDMLARPQQLQDGVFGIERGGEADYLSGVADNVGMLLDATRAATGDMPAGLAPGATKIFGEFVVDLEKRSDMLGNIGRTFGMIAAFGSDDPGKELVKQGIGEMIDHGLELRHGAGILGAATTGARLMEFGKVSGIGFALQHAVEGLTDGIADAPSLRYAPEASLNDMLRQNAQQNTDRLRRELAKAGVLGVPGALINATYHGIVSDLTALGTAARRGVGGGLD